MNIIKKIYGFVAKPFSKHFWWAIWLRFFSLFYKSVDAKTLKELCGYINPPYSLLLDFAEKQEFQHKSLHDRLCKADEVRSFYSDRDKSMQEIRYYLADSYRYRSLDDYEDIKKTFSPSAEKFLEMVKQAGLEGRVALTDGIIRFAGIKIKGDVDLALGGFFSRWEFDYVKFCGKVNIGVYPPTVRDFHKPGAGMFFSNNFCYGDFSCAFALVPNIHIRDSIFKSAADVHLGVPPNETMPAIKALGEWLKEDMASMTRDNAASAVKFSSNYVQNEVNIYDTFANNSSRVNIGGIGFVDGNVFGGLLTPNIRIPGRQYPITGVGEEDGIACGVVGHIYFDIDEKIKRPTYKKAAVYYKKFFVALKDEAIEKHNREDEFKYGRQERYFDWCLADRWQDKLIFSWSRFVSNSGISWFRPAVILLGGQWALAFLFIGKFGGCGDYAAWFQAAVESLNPLSSLPDIAEDCEPWNDSLSASIYNAVRRIFSLALLYEIVKVLRRFSN